MPTCPTCSTLYPGGVTVCPSDGTSLTAVMPPADAASPSSRVTPTNGTTPSSPANASRSPANASRSPSNGALAVTSPADARRSGDATLDRRSSGGYSSSDPGTRGPDALIGQTLAERYQLTRRIGEGGMGTVYEGTHVLIGKSVAVKVLREKYVDRVEVAQRMMQEARLASSIKHEHIVDITDFGTTVDGRTFVVMELLDGESLAELIRRDGPVPESRTIDIVRQAASALGAAHARGVVHRDVKPENIFLVEREGRDFVKVVDFGLSKLVRVGEGDPDTPRLTQTGQVLGTPLYMSPEQGRGEEDLDHRIDVYALGVILFECLTGEVPFRGANYLGIISQVLTQQPPRPRALRPELRISEAVERVVLKAMSKARDDRYATMAELEADLGRALVGESVEAPLPTTQPTRAARGLLWGGLTVFVVLVVAAGLGLFLRGRGAEPAPSPPLRPSGARPSASAPPAPSLPPATVVIHVETTPPGAEVRQGGRVFGVAPIDVTLPRANEPARLTFRLAGYEETTTTVVPTKNDRVQMSLKRAHLRRSKAPPAPSPTAPPTPRSEPRRGGETLPNPYN